MQVDMRMEEMLVERKFKNQEENHTNSNLFQTLLRHQLRERETEKDVDSLFTAISEALYNNKIHAWELRQNAVYFMEHHKENYVSEIKPLIEWYVI